MSRLMTKSLLVVVFGLATAAVGFAQRQPATSGGTSSSGSGTSTADRNQQTKDAHTTGSSNGSTNGATTAAGKSTSAKATFEVYKDKSGEYRWRLRATNTQILAMAAQGYSDKRSCLNAIESVKRDVASAPVKEEEAVAGKDDASTDGAAAKTAGSRSGDGSTSGSTSGTTSGSKSGSTSGTNSGTTGSKTSQK